MNKKLRIGLIGLGPRGEGLLKSSILPLCQEDENLELAVLCDAWPDRLENGAVLAEKALGKRPPLVTSDSEKALSCGIDAVVIATGWETHTALAIEAMKKGVYAGFEVGGAYNIEDCYNLVRVYEQTGTPCMMLENACYGKRELMVTNMVRKGVLGNVVHCAGGYHHDLRGLVANGRENRSYRLNNYIYRNCENYPTHELGPIAKLLGINNGNRMLTLNSVASCGKGLHEYCLTHRKEGDPLLTTDFLQGDIVTTTIKCSGGQTIVITLDTTLPRAYSRGFTVMGTKGMYQEDGDYIFLDGVHDEFDFQQSKLWGNASQYEADYIPDIWKDYKKVDDHGGLDTLTLMAFFESAREQKRPPVDVYDSVAWMSITALSEESILKGGAPVMIPDFTNGKWYRRKDINYDSIYCLD